MVVWTVGILLVMAGGFILGLFIAGARSRDGVASHVKIGDVWHEVDNHGRVIVRPEDKP